MFQNVRGLKENELVNVRYRSIVVLLLLSGGGFTKQSAHSRLDLNILLIYRTPALPSLLFSTFSSVLDIFFRFGATNLEPTSLQQLICQF